MQPELVREFIRSRDVLMSFLFALTGDHDAAEDVFQELALAIIAEAEKGTRPRHFMAWARTLARHRVADYYRARARLRGRMQTFESLADVVGRAFEENEIAAEDNQRRLHYLRECLEALGARAREIVHLRYSGRKPLREIAAAVAWKESSVKVALAKARRALRECVQGKLAAGGYE
jgi:RNA polymerase sigma-70 factor (ECF subfamily)